MEDWDFSFLSTSHRAGRHGHGSSSPFADSSGRDTERVGVTRPAGRCGLLATTDCSAAPTGRSSPEDLHSARRRRAHTWKPPTRLYASTSISPASTTPVLLCPQTHTCDRSVAAGQRRSRRYFHSPTLGASEFEFSRFCWPEAQVKRSWALVRWYFTQRLLYYLYGLRGRTE